jgi:hypothetical protein
MVSRSLFAVALLTAAANARAAEPVGRVVALTGEVQVRHGSAAAVALKRGDYLEEGDTVETALSGSVRLLMRDKSVLALPARASMRITNYAVNPDAKKRRVRLKILAGRLWAAVSEALGTGSKYEVESDNAVAGVRGTELVFDVGETGNAVVTVITGEVQLRSADAHESLGAQARGSVASAGTIAVDATTATGVAALRETVRPEPALDAANAERRLQALRKKSGEDKAALPELAEKGRATDRDQPGMGDSTFDNSTAPVPGDNGPDRTAGPGGLGMFDPSTMAHVRVRVEVRP